MACAYGFLGRKAEALQWLANALKPDPSCAAKARDDAGFDSIRADPDFRVLPASVHSDKKSACRRE
jgi:hypothetical protein